MSGILASSSVHSDSMEYSSGGKVEAERVAEQQRIATEQLFQKANASDESFRQTTEAQIRKRLFQAAHDPASNYHEIRWLLKCLEMVRPE